MPRIVVLSDGTGNAASSIWRTNVWRVFQALDLSGNAQMARYDDGVGTSAFLPAALIGGAFGYGLKRNVLDLYKFVCRAYSDGSEIYLFGFSRGAFTVRVLAGFILRQGLVQADTEDELDRKAREAYRAYRARYQTILQIEAPLRKLRDRLYRRIRRLRQKRSGATTEEDRLPPRKIERIRFIGVWDTVSAYGLPVDEMTRGVSDWLWPLQLPDRTLHEKVERAVHALSIDDERTTFHPVLWNEESEAARSKASHIDEERVSQVWFAGVHANVGGGYPDDALAHIPLVWIMEQAAKAGLVFKAQPDAFQALRSVMDKDGRQYDSRSGLGTYYRYGPRRLADLCHVPSNDLRDRVIIPKPKIHESVFQRLQSKSSAYAPLGLPLPNTYRVVTANGAIRDPDTTTEEPAHVATGRTCAQERVWNFVWLRRLVYFASVAALLHLIFFWIYHPADPHEEFETRFRLVAETVRAIESLLPSGLHWWTRMYAAAPGPFAVGVGVLGLFLATSGWLGRHINSRMRALWTSASVPRVTPLSEALIALRTSKPYRDFFAVLKRWVLPPVFALLLLWLGLGVTNHLAANVLDSFGTFCKPSKEPLRALNTPKQVLEARPFKTNDICSSTGIAVEADKRYLVTIEVTEAWSDKRIATSPLGFTTPSLASISTRLFMYAALPFRRVLFRNWFHPIARVGSTGTSENFLDPYQSHGKFKGWIRTERDGELYLYVNDGILAIPGLHAAFYGNNKGAAKVTVTMGE